MRKSSQKTITITFSGATEICRAVDFLRSKDLGFLLSESERVKELDRNDLIEIADGKDPAIYLAQIQYAVLVQAAYEHNAGQSAIKN
jgi:hypothetical protein